MPLMSTLARDTEHQHPWSPATIELHHGTPLETLLHRLIMDEEDLEFGDHDPTWLGWESVPVLYTLTSWEYGSYLRTCRALEHAR